MSSPNPVFSTPEEQAKALADFIAKHARPYDQTTDEYERPPFAADTKEGKNDPIYNAHSYHTKVPPRSIVPYILHYTQPGDLVLDLFCGSGMTGVAAQMCDNPPPDILEQFADLKDRVGPRACILNDLSPAACHIAYNYNTPVDVNALKREFERIKAAVQKEFDWLYGTEHYEPAVGVYDPTNAEVATRLKNPPASSMQTLLAGEDRAWELLTKSEVEARLGYPVTDLPHDDQWGELDVAKVEQWVCIPAIIQYTIWSDVCRCEGFISLEEPTGKVSTRGKNAGKPIVRTKRVERGCGATFSLYDVAMDHETTKVRDEFQCPSCNQPWSIDNVTLLEAKPNEVVYHYEGIRHRDDGSAIQCKAWRTVTSLESSRIRDIARRKIPFWHPTTPLVPGEQGNPFISRGLVSVDQLYTPRNLFALSQLWNEINSVSNPRIRDALTFLFTSVSARNLSRMTRYRKRGNEALSLRLFIPHFQAELNPLRVLEGKFKDIHGYFAAQSSRPTAALVVIGPAQELGWLPDASVDFVFADPPFGRNIAYAELNVLWEAWLGVVTDVPKEAITSNGRKLGVESYVEKMQMAFCELFRVVKPGRYVLIEFNNGDPALGLFEHIKQAGLAAGFEITNMMILDKEHKSFNQVVGSIRGEGTVDKDVVFSFRKPAVARTGTQADDNDLEQQVAAAVRQHLQSLPERIKAESAKYNDDHRTTATINSMLMNALIPRGVNVDKLNLPFIDRVCGRFFRKVGQRWYLRGEAVGNHTGPATLLEMEVAITDEVSAIEWLRQKIKAKPALIGELKPLWMRSTGLLPPELSQSLVLDDLLMENFWRDGDSNRWREPTVDEREKMSDDRSIRVLHDAERFVAGSLRRTTTDSERCEWIDVLFQACRDIEDDEQHAIAAMRGFERLAGYGLITRLFQTILREKVAEDAYGRAQKQMRAASQRLAQDTEAQAATAAKERGKAQGPTLFDNVGGS